MKNINEKPKHVLTGKVISDKMDKTIVVEVKRTYTHPLYHKVMHAKKKYKVHDESGTAKVGDIVEIYEGRPVSKTKYMYLDHVLKSGTEVNN